MDKLLSSPSAGDMYVSLDTKQRQSTGAGSREQGAGVGWGWDFPQHYWEGTRTEALGFQGLPFLVPFYIAC